MPAGFSVFLDDDQTIQIDETYRNLELSGVYRVRPNRQIMNIPPQYDTYLTVSGLVNPVVAVKPVTGRIAQIETTYSGGNTTYRFCGSSGSTADIYIFDNATQGQGNLGLQVFDAQGTLTYDSSKKYLRVVSETQFADYNNVRFPYPIDDRDYAYVLSGMLGFVMDYHDAYEFGDPFSVRTKSAAFFTKANGFFNHTTLDYFNSGRSSVGNTSPFTYSQFGGTLQVIDVTRY